VNWGRKMKDTCTYWGAPTVDGYGTSSFAAPVTMSCHWENSIQEYLKDSGEEAVSNAIVFTASDVEIGGYLFQGTSVETDPTTLEGAHQIHQFYKIPDVRSIGMQRKAVL
jgi:hypothetical protein